MSGGKRKSDDTQYEDRDIFNDLNLSCLLWSKRKFTLKEFANTFKTPQMIFVCKGQYIWRFPSDFGLNSWIFAWCKKSRFKVQAQCLHSEKREAGHLFEIEDDYGGLFEILSEERRGLLQTNRVRELAKYPGKPFMLMESMPVYVSTPEDKEQRYIRHKGYKIIVDKPVTAAHDCKSDPMLRCYSFSGETLFLSMEETGNFAMIGDSKGLQTISSLKAFNQFPIDVELVDGRPPPGAECEKRFSPYMRFQRGRSEEVLTVWTMEKDAPLIHIPIECPLEVLVLENLNVVRELPIHKEIVRRIQKISKLEFEVSHQPQTSSQIRASLQTTSSTILSPPMYATSTSIPLQSTSGFPKLLNALHRPSTSILPTITSTTEIHLPTTSDQVPVDATDIHQPSTSGLSTSSYIHQPSTSGSVAKAGENPV